MPLRQLGDEEIIQKINEYMDASDHPDLVGYRTQSRERDFADPYAFLRNVRLIAKLGDFRAKRILDVGCGLGWYTVALSLLEPSNELVGMDILPSMIDAMNECLHGLKSSGTRLSVSAVCGDICKPECPANSFDGIYSIEAIEHVHDIDAMLESCARLLKRGGRMVLVNDQNGRHRETRERIMAMWQLRETSVEWCEYLKSIRPVEHRDAKPFVQMRADIIAAAEPNVPQTVALHLATATAGLLKPEIEAIARDTHKWNAVPYVHPFDRCRNPLTGEYAERLFDPFDLLKRARKAGFRVRLRHNFRRWPLHWLNDVQFSPLNVVLFGLRPIFMLVAEKL